MTIDHTQAITDAAAAVASAHAEFIAATQHVAVAYKALVDASHALDAAVSALASAPAVPVSSAV